MAVSFREGNPQLSIYKAIYRGGPAYKSLVRLRSIDCNIWSFGYRPAAVHLATYLTEIQEELSGRVGANVCI